MRKDRIRKELLIEIFQKKKILYSLKGLMSKDSFAPVDLRKKDKM